MGFGTRKPTSNEPDDDLHDDISRKLARAADERGRFHPLVAGGVPPRQGRLAALQRIKAVIEHYFIQSPLELLTTDIDELDKLIDETKGATADLDELNARIASEGT